MMWLNPFACMGTGRPLISSCLMRDIDRPHLTQRPARCRAALPPPLALVLLDAIKKEKRWKRQTSGNMLKEKLLQHQQLAGP